jgi:drug/metabolite transporter (DMT)-like permease
MLVAGALLLVVSAASGELAGFSLSQVSGRSLVAWGWLVGAGSVIAYSAYTYALKTLPTATVATYAYVNPVIAVLLGVVILDELVTGQMLLAGTVIVASVALIVTAQRHRH